METCDQDNQKPSTDNTGLSELKPLRTRAFSDMGYVEYIKNYGAPPAPLFKPQAAPNDAFGDMELPPSELGDDERGDMMYHANGLDLVQEEDMDEDEENDRVDLPVVKQAESKVQKFLGGLSAENDDLKFGPFLASTRYRSRSENLNNGSIFKFMENTLGGRKDQVGVNSFY